MKFATNIILALAICGAHAQLIDGRAMMDHVSAIPTFKPITYTDPKSVLNVFNYYGQNNIAHFAPDASCTTKPSADASNAALKMLNNNNIQCDSGSNGTLSFFCYPWNQVITAQTFMDDFNTLDNKDRGLCTMLKVPNIIEFAMEKGKPIEGKCWMENTLPYEEVQIILLERFLSCELKPTDANILSCIARKRPLPIKPSKDEFEIYGMPENMFKENVFTVIPKINESTEKDHTSCRLSKEL